MASVVDRFDALDRKDEQTIAYDTGKTVATDYDEANVAGRPEGEAGSSLLDQRPQ